MSEKSKKPKPEEPLSKSQLKRRKLQQQTKDAEEEIKNYLPPNTSEPRRPTPAE